MNVDYVKQQHDQVNRNKYEINTNKNCDAPKKEKNKRNEQMELHRVLVNKFTYYKLFHCCCYTH